MKKQIMRSANFRAKTEGRPEALKASHKANKGTLVSSGKTVLTLKQQSRLYSDFKGGEQVVNEIVEKLDIDFAGMM